MALEPKPDKRPKYGGFGATGSRRAQRITIVTVTKTLPKGRNTEVLVMRDTGDAGSKHPYRGIAAAGVWKRLGDIKQRNSGPPKDAIVRRRRSEPA